MNKYLIKLADHLDKKGLHKEADYVDWLIKQANPMSFMEKPETSGYDPHLQRLSDEAVRDAKTAPLNSLNTLYRRFQNQFTRNKKAIELLKALQAKEGNEVYYSKEGIGKIVGGVQKLFLSGSRLRYLPYASTLSMKLSKQSGPINIGQVIETIETYQNVMQKSIPKMSALLKRRKPAGEMNENISKMYDAGFDPLK